jgi:HD-like signal output (HDOD) protein
MNSIILDNIKSLPPLPRNVTHLQEIFNNPESSLGEIAKAIENDPMMTANLLKEINSPLYGMSKDVKTVSQAISLLGMEITRSIILGSSIRKLLNVDMEPYAIVAETFVKISTAQAMLARVWYRQVDKNKADMLFLAAMLQEIGKILISNYIIRENETISFQSEVKNSRNIADVEKMYIGETAGSVTAAIFEHWKMDAKLVKIIRYCDAPQNAPEDIRAHADALQIVKTVVPVNDPFGALHIQIGLEKAKNMGYEPSILQKAIEETSRQSSLF